MLYVEIGLPEKTTGLISLVAGYNTEDWWGILLLSFINEYRDSYHKNRA